MEPLPAGAPYPSRSGDSFLTDARFRDPDRIFDAIIYTSRSDNIMRYSDEVRVSIIYPHPRFLFFFFLNLVH